MGIKRKYTDDNDSLETKGSNTNMSLHGNEILLNVNGSYFQFNYVPADGDCFYHSILKSDLMKGKFGSVYDLRYYLNKVVLLEIESDIILQRIFQFYMIDLQSWSIHILKMHEWAKSIDMMIFSYITKINVVTVGNYMNGIQLNNMHICMRQILSRYNVDILMTGCIHVYFHNFGYPLCKSTNGNHFGYLEPVSCANINVPINTIVRNQLITNKRVKHTLSDGIEIEVKQECVTNRNSKRYVWTTADNIELYICYRLAKIQKLKV